MLRVGGVSKLGRRSGSLAALAVLATVLFGGVALAAPEFPNEWFYYNNDQRLDNQRVLVGQPMPPLDLKEWKNQGFDEKKARGKILLVDFWATWCGPCIASIPHNNEVAAKYAKQDVLVLGVCTSRGQEKFAEVVKERGIAYACTTDPGEAAAKRWRVGFYPTYAVVDRKGIVRAIGLNPNGAEKVIERLIEADPKS